MIDRASVLDSILLAFYLIEMTVEYLSNLSFPKEQHIHTIFVLRYIETNFN